MQNFIKPSRSPLVFPALALCLCAGKLGAQVAAPADVLSGRVTDLTGKPVADAQVITTASGSGLTRSATTDAEGRYRIFFPETATEYQLQVKRMGFTPVQRTIIRQTLGSEQMTIDLQLGGTPLALSMVEINGSPDGVITREPEKASVDATVPNPVADILAMRDTLHLSAVQIVALTDVADTLHSKNSKVYQGVQMLLAKSAEAGDATQMAGTVAMMLEEASANTAQAVTAAKKLLRPQQWGILPPTIRDHPDPEKTTTARH
jgi:hypothetical protein